LFNGEGGELAGGDGIRPERVERVGYDVGGEGRHRLVHENARTVPPRCTRLALFFRVVALVKGVLDVKGDASVAIAWGKKRYLFDYHATVEYDLSDGGEKSSRPDC
jgi:hypothetical protein